MNKIILLNVIVGSQAYGTNTPDSDIDTKGVYLQDLKTINVRVKNPEYLLSIRHGKVSLEELLESARNQIKGLKQKFEDSDLPHSVDPDLVKSILNEIRKESLNLF